jgi:leucyl aminopeptidase
MSIVLKISSYLILVLVLANFAFGQKDARRSASKEFWVSVDYAELNHIKADAMAGGPASLAGIEPEKIVGELAILRLSPEQMEDLSRSMHSNFNKCSGYVAHATEMEAMTWARDHYATDPEAQFVNYTIDNPMAVNSMLPYVSEQQIRQVILDLSAFPNRRYNLQSGIDSANWIRNKWAQLISRQSRGQVTLEFFNHPASTSPQPSIILTFRGTEFPNEIVVLGAHQDSINSSSSSGLAPGADDDASGIACLTETIRVLTETGFRPRRTVQFMAYAAEEAGLRGSNAIATAYRNENKNVIGVLQLDMTNFRGTQGFDMAFITDNTNAAQNQFLRDLVSVYQPGLNVTNSTCGYACSDHASWHNKNYPASFPFEAPMNNHNSAIHTVNDTIARSNNNANHSVNFAKLALSYIAELAKGCVAIASRCS